MAIRHRSFNQVESGYIRHHQFDGATPTGGYSDEEVLFDSASGSVNDVSPGWDQVNPFELVRYENRMSGLSGWSGTTAWSGLYPNQPWYIRVPWRTYENVMPNLAYTPDHYHLPTKTLTNVEALARMSPNQPVVDLPLFLFELKDLPGMAKAVYSFGKSLPATIEKIRDGGWAAFGDKANRKSALNRLAGANLQLGFGYAPLASDLADMLGLGEAVKRRLDQLQRMKSSKGLRRRIAIDSRTVSDFMPLQSYGIVGGHVNIVGSVSFTKTTRTWSTSLWKEIGGIMPSVDDSVLGATRSVLGLNLSAASIWNAIPWSFLVDYFTDIGSYLDLQRNSLENRCVRFALMTETVASTTYAPIHYYSADVATGVSGSIKVIHKSRTPVDPSSLLPSFTPFLSVSQASNLASLSVARRNVWNYK